MCVEYIHRYSLRDYRNDDVETKYHYHPRHELKPIQMNPTWAAFSSGNIEQENLLCLKCVFAPFNIREKRLERQQLDCRTSQILKLHY